LAPRTTARKKYGTSPVEEASCEFEFSEKAWDISLPARIYEKLRATYPQRPLPLTVDGTPTIPRTVMPRAAHAQRVLLASADRTAQVRYGQNDLSIHLLAPYPGFPEFLDRIREALRVFITAATPKTCTQINVRYKNKIVVPLRSMLFADYFTLGATIPKGLPTRLMSYATALRSAYDDNPQTVLSLSFSATPERGKRSVEALLDIMTSRVQLKEAAEPNPLQMIVEDLHNRVEDAFEKAITNETRALFR